MGRSKKSLQLFSKVLAAVLIFTIPFGCSYRNVLPNIPKKVQSQSASHHQNYNREIDLTVKKSEFSKDEINLNDTYLQSITNDPELNDTSVQSAINKWFFEIYPYGFNLANAFELSSLMDPETFEWAAALKNEVNKHSDFDGKITAINKWLTNFLHTQGVHDFSEMPGKDPWGITDDSGYPTYKSETPSEMKGLSVFTGENTGKCNSLATTNADAMLLLGVNPDNIMQIILECGTDTHVISFVKFKGKLLYFNNTSVTALDNSQGLMENLQAKGFLNYSTNQAQTFEITGKFYNDIEPLIKSLARLAKVSDSALGNKLNLIYQFKNRNDLVSAIFMNKEHSDLYTFTKYEYQSLYVKKPQMYLEASMKTSRARDLANKLNSPEEIFHWIKKNIAANSIFQDSADRIMTADEVIACKTGDLKDQAVLAFTLLKHKGFNPTIYICKDNVYIGFDNKLYQVKDWSTVQSINDNVLLKLTLK